MTNPKRIRQRHQQWSRMIERRNRSVPHLFRASDMKLFAAGVSHKTAPVNLRERLSVQRHELVDVAGALKWRGELDEVVLLSTCNRVENYGTTEGQTTDIQQLFQCHYFQARELT